VKYQISNIKYQIIFFGYILASLFLLLFSYTQVDLNLTLSQVGIWQGIQKAFQHVGYYQRPLATGVYVSVLLLLFTSYSILLSEARKNRIGTTALWKLILIVTGILVFSYPAAFSYDFFNYLFTAKTVLVYRLNPYTVVPLQFAGIDPWTNFMRWTHLPSAYTPFWIVLSLLPYLLGLGYFILVLFSMKFMIAGFYILACWALVKTIDRVDVKRTSHALAFFALNPLILIESLVSAHNDIVLIAFALLSVWMYLQKQYLSAWLYLAISVAAKFMTLFLVPVYVLKRGRGWMLGALLLGLTFVLIRREFLPWYWVWILPFVALHMERVKLVRFATVVSLGLVLSYAPFLWFGEYSTLEQLWKTSIIWVSVGLGTIFYGFRI